MEVFILLTILLFLSSLFLSFWVRNLINKIKTTAQKRQEVINILHTYISLINETSSLDMWAGHPEFNRFKIQTENLIRYLQADEIYEEIKFLFEKDTE